MTRCWSLAAVAAAALLSAAAARSQDVIVNTQKKGTQSTTTIVVVEPPKVVVVKPGVDPAAVVLGPGEAVGVVLTVKAWVCGKQFTDEQGRVWVLGFGLPVAAKPPKISGWLITTRDNRLFFFTVDGCLFAPPAVLKAAAPPAPMPMPPLPAKALDALQKKVDEAIQKSK